MTRRLRGGEGFESLAQGQGGVIVETNGINRREFLRLSVIAAFGAIAAACARATPTPVAVVKEATKALEEKPEPTATSLPAAVREAPGLHAKVLAGELPPLEQRLPKEPLVLVREGMDQQIGTHSDDRPFISASASTQQIAEYFLMLNADATKTIPNIGKAWKTSEDGKTFTVYLREGLKWSDGEPFTADDIVFWYEDNLKNEELSPVFPSAWKIGGEPMKMVKLDDFTVELQFAAPFYYTQYTINSNGFRGNQQGGGGGFYLPAHFLKQFHIKYNDKADDLAKEKDYENWYQLFKYYGGAWNALPIGLPQMGPWLRTEESPTGNTYERNPYYFKVDPEGNQLPYISTLKERFWGDQEGHLMLMMTGEIDYESWNVGIGNWPALKKNEEKSNFDLWIGGDCWVGYADYWLNETYDLDPELGEIFRDARFRQALSLAMDRDELVEKLGLGHGEPMQATAWKYSSYYKEEWGKAYADYDVKRANALLDEMGLDKRDDEGFRTKLSGDSLTIVIECHAQNPFYVPTGELAKSYWGAVGVRTILKVQDRQLLWARLGGEMQIFTWVLDNQHEFVMLAGKAGYQRMNWWGRKWFQWLTTDGEEGWEPPDDVKRLYELCESIPSTPPDKVGARMQEICEDQVTNIRAIGTVGYVGKPILTKKDLGNVDYKAYADNAGNSGCRTNWVEMWYWKK